MAPATGIGASQEVASIFEQEQACVILLVSQPNAQGAPGDVPSMPLGDWHYRRASIHSNQSTSSEETKMKLQLKDQAADPVAIIELRQDAGDINIYINGEMVAYFTGNTVNVHLELVRVIGAARHYVDLDDRDCIVVRC